MTTPTGTISLQDIKDEFGGSASVSLSHYYAGGAHISLTPPTSIHQTKPIPTTGEISLGMFRGLSAITPVTLSHTAQTDMYGHNNGPWPTSYFISPNSYGANATNLHFILTAGGGSPATNPSAVYTWSLDVLSTNFYTAVIQDPEVQQVFVAADPVAGTDAKIIYNTDTPLTADLPFDTVPANKSIQDFVVSGDHSGNITWYRVNVTDGHSTSSITLGVGLWW